MNLITKLAYNALTKTIQAIAPGGVSLRMADYEEGTWSPNPFSLTNLTGTPTVTDAKYTRVGKLVIFQFKINGTSVTSTATQTAIQFKYPIAQASNSDMCSGVSYVTIAPYVATVADSTGGNGTDGSVIWQSNGTGSLVINVLGSYMI